MIKSLDDKLLLVSLLVVATCALTYELLIGTIASYFMGSSVLHFSLTTGAFLFFTGIGSYLSKFIKENLVESFIFFEILLGVIGGVSGLVLFFVFSATDYFYLAALFFLATTGIIAGLEIPLLTRILTQKGVLKDVLASVFAIDYLGAVFASVMFPLVLLPALGAMRVGILVGALNLSVSLVVLSFFKDPISHRSTKSITSLMGILFLLSIFVYSEPLKAVIEKRLFQDDILLSKESQYQHIVLTGHHDDTRLYLNGDLQFSSIDEYRYHEPLVHIPLGMISRPRNVLLLGAGDGLAVREILKHSSIESITLVDLDPEVVTLSKTHPLLSALNMNSLMSEKVHIHTKDAFTYLLHNTEIYDAIIIDLPDPNDENLGRLYTTEFYTLARRALSPEGVMISQAGSPYFTREAFWSIGETLKEVFPHTLPIQVQVPSFGSWGFQIAASRPLNIESVKLPEGLKYLSSGILKSFTIFEEDTKNPGGVSVSTIDNLFVIHAYRRGKEEFD